MEVWVFPSLLQIHIMVLSGWGVHVTYGGCPVACGPLYVMSEVTAAFFRINFPFFLLSTHWSSSFWVILPSCLSLLIFTDCVLILTVPSSSLSISCSSFSSLVLVPHRGIHSLPSPQLQVLGDVPNHWGHVVANTGGTGYPWPEGSSWQRWPQEQAEVAFRRSL